MIKELIKELAYTLAAKYAARPIVSQYMKPFDGPKWLRSSSSGDNKRKRARKWSERKNDLPCCGKWGPEVRFFLALLPDRTI